MQIAASVLLVKRHAMNAVIFLVIRRERRYVSG